MQMIAQPSRRAWPLAGLGPEAKAGPPLVTRFPPDKLVFCGSEITENELRFLLHLPDGPA